MNAIQNDDNWDKIEYLMETVSTRKTLSKSPRFHGGNNENDNISEAAGIERGNDPNETEISGSTGVSDPIQAKDNKSTLKSNKAISYQDIHSEYTKKRYRNVESKVAQYIANIRAQDKKRQNSRKSLSHGTLIQYQHEQKRQQQQQEQQQQHDEIHEDNEIMSPTSDDTAFNSHETSVDGIIYIEKHIYEQLLKIKDKYDYLEATLEEKQGENFRLKRNLDSIRIKLSQCEDKLKEKTKYSNNYRSVNNLNSVGLLSKYATQTFLYPLEKFHKITQTEITLTSSPLPRQASSLTPIQTESFSAANINIIPTPITPDLRKPSLELNMLGIQAPIKVNKSMATIQPLALNFSTMERKYEQYNDQNNVTLKFFRQRSNSLVKQKKFSHTIELTDTNNNDSIIVEPSSTPAKENQTTTITISPIIINTMNRNRSKRFRKHIKKLFKLCTKCPELSNRCDNNNNSNNNLLDSVATTANNTTTQELNTYTRTQ